MKEEIIGSRRFLVYELAPQEAVNPVILRMMEHNAMPGLLPVTFLQKDQRQILLYDCSGLTALEDCLGQVQDGIWLVSLFTDLAGILLEAEEYMIKEPDFLFGTDTVFLTPKGKAAVVCLPLEDGQNASFRQFCRGMLTQPAAAGSLGRGLQEQIEAYLSRATFSAQEFSQLLAQLELRSAVSVPEAAAEQRKSIVLGKRERAGKKETEKKLTGKKETGRKGTGQAGGCLYRKSSKETIEIDQEEFLIGKGSSCNGYRIQGNSFVSRQHAKIIRQGDTFSITDLQSTNHTYVGGRKLAPGQAVILEDQAVIRLANEEFIFLTGQRHT